VSNTEDIRDVVRTVTMHRRKGDALARTGNEPAAMRAYQDALRVVGDALMETRPDSPNFDVNRAELLGTQGGLLRRAGRMREALESYRRGAAHEIASGSAVTYNRVNAIKLALIAGDQTVSGLQPDLEDVQRSLEERLSVDQRAADDGWLWADLGDVRLLRGDPDGAARAYRSFAAKATSGSPSSTLSVLDEIVKALNLHGDESAVQVADSVKRMKRVFALRN
jgi:hypothetical protein